MDINTLLSFFGAAIGILGLVTGFYFYRKSQKEKEPCWSIRSSNLIEDYVSQFDGIEVLYKGQKVENLTISDILFWNNGRETIDGGDISIANPLAIVSSDGTKLLDAKVVTGNNPANQFSCALQQDQNLCFLTFDYLNHRQGALIQVIHIGKSSKSISVIGDIKGATSIKAYTKGFPSTRRSAMVISAVGVVGVALGFLSSAVAFAIEDVSAGIIFLVITGILLMAFSVLLKDYIPAFLQSRPMGFDDFEVY